MGKLVDLEDHWPYARELYQLPGVQKTCVMDHVKAHYYRSHEDLDPARSVPVGPDVDWSATHDRDDLGGERPNFDISTNRS